MGTEPSSTSATDARVAHTGAGERPASAASAGPATASWDDMVLVGRVARVHGLKGHVVVAPETDFVDERFSVGSRLWSRSAAGAIEALDVRSMRTQGGRPVVHFEGFADVSAVERLVGSELRIPEEELQPLAAGVLYHHQLVGCAVETTAGDRVGEVARVEGGSAGSLLVVRGARGEVLVPFAEAICVEVNVDLRRIRIRPPEGLLEVNETTRKRRRAPG